MSRFLAGASAVWFGWAALAAIRLAVAETIFREDTPAAIVRAISMQGMFPDADYEERLAELDPAQTSRVLEHVVTAVDARASGAWMSLGMWEESVGDRAKAEKCLLRAAQIDHQYLPAWTLTNFYFRGGNRELFWVWAKQAAALTYDEFPPLLRLCDQFEPDPARMLARLEGVSRIRAPYLNFLIGENRLDAAQRVARGMFGDHARDSQLLTLAEAQLRAGNAAAAMEMWNAASGFAPVQPSAGKILTNGDLARAPLSLGFDWRLGQVEGMGSSWKPSELVFIFSGSEPETCVLLEQTICLVTGHFRLRFEYRTRDGPVVGMRWSLDDEVGSKEGPLIEPSEGWREGQFEVPRTSGLKHLKLFYRRESGTTRAEGRAEIRNLRWEAQSSTEPK
jgi:tetratricopeptide (TPR) repeat protein